MNVASALLTSCQYATTSRGRKKASGMENAMFFTDNPFSKYAYGDMKTEANCLEVAAAYIAAKRLGLLGDERAYLVNATTHAWYLYVNTKKDERKILDEASKVPIEEAREVAFDVLEMWAEPTSC